MMDTLFILTISDCELRKSQGRVISLRLSMLKFTFLGPPFFQFQTEIVLFRRHRGITILFTSRLVFPHHRSLPTSLAEMK